MIQEERKCHANAYTNIRICSKDKMTLLPALRNIIFTMLDVKWNCPEKYNCIQSLQILTSCKSFSGGWDQTFYLYDYMQPVCFQVSDQTWPEISVLQLGLL